MDNHKSGILFTNFMAVLLFGSIGLLAVLLCSYHTWKALRGKK